MISLGIAPGGAQQHFGVVPDLTCCGKVIGGGLPIGCIGGRAELMEIFDPVQRRPAVNHGGTFAGHPLAMVAGAAQLDALTPEVHAELHRKGDRLRALLAELFAERAAPLCVTGVGQLFAWHATPGPVERWEDTLDEDAGLAQRLLRALARRGIHQVSTRGSVSLPMGEPELLAFRDALDAALGACGVAG